MIDKKSKKMSIFEKFMNQILGKDILKHINHQLSVKRLQIFFIAFVFFASFQEAISQPHSIDVKPKKNDSFFI